MNAPRPAPAVAFVEPVTPPRIPEITGHGIDQRAGSAMARLALTDPEAREAIDQLIGRLRREAAAARVKAKEAREAAGG